VLRKLNPKLNRDLPAMKQAVSVTMVVGALLLVASSLQGCGCDKDEGEKCMKDHGAALLTETDCTGFDKYAKCIDDASCCDLEEDGTSMKDALNTLKGTKDCKNPC